MTMRKIIEMRKLIKVRFHPRDKVLYSRSEKRTRSPYTPYSAVIKKF